VTIRELARERLGFERLRPGQEQAVAAAAAGRDVLAVMPTGGGKSAIYELAGLLRSGPTVVVSPLIALQDDQLAHLRAAGLPATVLNSAQSGGARAAALVEACGPDEFVFVSPEQLANDETRAALRRARPGLFVVDEAHLVSQWGRDFRPDYLRLGAQADEFGVDVRIALTATAAPPVRREICRRLRLRDPEEVLGDLDRPHIDLSVQHARSSHDKQRLIAQVAAELGGSGIVYAATHASAEAARQTLVDAGERATLYHAGLGAGARRQAMEEFLDGSARIVAATVAFGMGVDKADVRTVCHETVPGSIEAYYQEAGRAGRDGAPARCLLFASARDKGLHVFFIERSTVGDDELKAVARAIVRSAEPPAAGGPQRYDIPAGFLASLADGEEEKVRAIVGHLARTGVVQPAPSAPDRVAGRLSGEWDGSALARCRTAAQEGTKARWRQYRSVWAWVEGDGCRREGILRHFGDRSAPAPAGPCCDVCDPSLRPAIPNLARPPRRARSSSGPRQLVQRPVAAGDVADLDEAILETVAAAQPEVGRTRAVEVLRGGRSKVVQKYSYDGLQHYGAYGHLRAESVLERVDALIAAGTLRSTGGRFPKLEVA
jgi:ATP-dependent DNA helicase RecQ